MNNYYRQIVLLNNLFVLCLLIAGVAGGCASQSPQPIYAVYADEIKLNGLASENVWQKASWVQIDKRNPDKLLPGQEEEQFHQKASAAVAWNSKGLYVAMVADDYDIQGNKLKNNDWIWLEDALEVFMAPMCSDKCPDFHVELQVNPAGTTFMQSISPEDTHLLSEPDGVKVAVFVDGTLNDSAKRDRTFSCEWFFSWDALKSIGLIDKGYVSGAGTPLLKMRFSVWDINIYSQIRLNRLSTPGTKNPHEPKFYRPVILEH